ncbi:Urease subunit gamma [Maliponia aquimaris]|uniref:Urease subunit gamma n=1 Tax=Maliponia aquimaris TaxID=1673631 RepID=A0A238K5U8_9RHOB|nr:Urease subunit gamma [Maliponia aquimaris]
MAGVAMQRRRVSLILSTQARRPVWAIERLRRSGRPRALFRCRAGAGVLLTLTRQAAERIYRAALDVARGDTRLTAWSCGAACCRFPTGSAGPPCRFPGDLDDMQLTPHERDTLLVTMAAKVARKRLARGVS